MMKANKKVMAALLAAMMTVSAGAAVSAAGTAVETPVTGPVAGTPASTAGTWYSHQFIENGKIVTKYAYKDAGSSEYVSNAWRLLNNKWYYFGADGYANYNEVEQIGGVNYRFGTDYAMVTGWYQNLQTPSTPSATVGNGWEYYNPTTGAQQLGWIKEGANWYFITNGTAVVTDANGSTVSGAGALLMNGTYTIDGVKYTFAANGVMQNQGQGWVKDGNNWYYINEKGEKVKSSSEGNADGWKLINGKYYFFHTNGVMATGWIKVTNASGQPAWYYCTANGDCVLNTWVKTNNNWYLVNPSGEMLTGWVVRNGKTYFLDNTSNGQYSGAYGAMATGTIEINYNRYTFDANGALVSVNGQSLNLENAPTA